MSACVSHAQAEMLQKEQQIQALKQRAKRRSTLMPLLMNGMATCERKVMNSVATCERKVSEEVRATAG